MAFCADAEQQGLLSLGLWYGQHQEQLKHREELSSNTAKDWFGHVMWFGVTFDGVGELREKKGVPSYSTAPGWDEPHHPELCDCWLVVWKFELTEVRSDVKAP